MRSRRQVLAGIGAAGLAGLAGCSALPFTGDGEDDESAVEVPADAVEPIAWPDSPFPVDVPPSLAESHRERARELLEPVPADPAIPNQAVAEELRSDREGAADRLGEAPGDPWPVDALSSWRGRRGSAANVRGTYRAATGEDDATAVDERRRTLRDDLGSFVADHDYRATTPLEAVLVHAPVEDLRGECRRGTRPTPAYPDDPVARPFRAGEAVGRLERGRAALADARGLREAYLAERTELSPQWTTLIDAADRLRVAVSRTHSRVDGFLDAEDPFERDLEGTPARTLFGTGARQVRTANDDFGAARDDGEDATAVLAAGRTLAAVEALEAVIDGIRDDAYAEVTEDSTAEAADRARAAIADVEAARSPALAARIVRPAIATYESVRYRIEDGYADAAHATGDLAWVELYARAVPAAADFVFDRLEDANDG